MRENISGEKETHSVAKILINDDISLFKNINLQRQDINKQDKPDQIIDGYLTYNVVKILRRGK